MYLLVVDRHHFQSQMSGHYYRYEVPLLDLLVSQSNSINKFCLESYTRLRYSLEGDRPSQTVHSKIFSI